VGFEGFFQYAQFDVFCGSHENVKVGLTLFSWYTIDEDCFSSELAAAQEELQLQRGSARGDGG
jgi:hypothetical protein